MSNGAMTTTPEKQLSTVRDMLNKMRHQLEMALPSHLGVDRFMRVALTSCQRNPKLLDCAPITLIGAMVQCAQLGLEPDDGTGKAYFVPFNNRKKNRLEVQFIPGYRGLIDLARRSKEIVQIETRVVREGDDFRFSFGLTPELLHVPKAPLKAKPSHFYAIARYHGDAGAQFDVMTVEEVDRIRGRSKASGEGPWVTDYDEMGKKTVLRRLCKLLPVSVELQRAITLDERHERGLAQDLGVLADSTETGTGDESPADNEPKPPKATAPAQTAEATDWRKMTLRREGLCMKCGVVLVAGKPAMYSASLSRVKCETCPTPASTEEDVSAL